MPATLLITATITPASDAPVLKARDPEQRLREYLAALEFYLSLPAALVSRTVFAENSGSDLTPINRLAERLGVADRLQAIHVPSAPARLGRGVGEATLVDAVMRSLPDDGELIWKITGRYTVHNLAKLIRTAPRTELYINLRRRPQPWCDTYAYAFTPTGYNAYLADVADRMRNDQRHGEEVMATLVDELIAAGAPIVPRFRYEPRVEGVRGHDLAAYGTGRQRAKYYVRVATRRLAPRVWV